jgi:hypothetical protein
MRDGAWPLTTPQKAMALVAKVLPQPVLQRLAKLAGRFSSAKDAEQQGN